MRKKDVFVLDFTSKFISAGVVKVGYNNIYTPIFMERKAYSGFENGNFYNSAEVSEIVNSLTSKARNFVKSKCSLFVGVPAHFTKVVTKEIELNFGKRRKIKESDVYALYDKADDFDAENFKVINRSTVTYVLDDGSEVINPVGCVSGTLFATVSVVLADNNFISFIDSNLPNLNAESIEYVSSALCQALYLVDQVQRDENAIILDVGYISSSVVVAKGDGLLCQSTFQVGGGHFAGDLSTVLKMPFFASEKLVKQIELTLEYSDMDAYHVNINEKNFHKTYSARLVNEIVASRVEMIADLVNKAILPFKKDLPEYLPVYVTGECVNDVSGLKNILSKRLERSVEVVVPKSPEYASPEWSSVFALVDIANKQQNQNAKTIFQKLLGI